MDRHETGTDGARVLARMGARSVGGDRADVHAMQLADGWYAWVCVGACDVAATFTGPFTTERLALGSLAARLARPLWVSAGLV